ncbi:MAG TPA: hypothetical protein VN238_16545 [Solirubrobacteraceae bacterium]|nr:hypothetical protein [Solirubrobacteraceae bacterium]
MGQVAILLLAEDRDGAARLVAEVEVAPALFGQDGDRYDDTVRDRELLHQRRREREVDGDLPSRLVAGQQLDGLDTTVDPRRRLGDQRRAGRTGDDDLNRLVVPLLVAFCHLGHPASMT